MKKWLFIIVLGAIAVCGTEAASAFISANTIDAHATYKQDGARVRVTGPIGCTGGERVAIRVTVTQAATGAGAGKTWKSRCTGEIQHWQVRARTRQGIRFEEGTARVCADGTTRSAHRVTDTRMWCARVSLTSGF